MSPNIVEKCTLEFTLVNKEVTGGDSSMGSAKIGNLDEEKLKLYGFKKSTWIKIISKNTHWHYFDLHLKKHLKLKKC